MSLFGVCFEEYSFSFENINCVLYLFAYILFLLLYYLHTLELYFTPGIFKFVINTLNLTKAELSNDYMQVF